MMYKAGLVSFYGPCVMCDFGEYVSMSDYTARAVRDVLFGDSAGLDIPPSPLWSDHFIPWGEENLNTPRQYKPETHGYELLQGSGKVSGHLLGGCIDVFPMVLGTEIFPTPEQYYEEYKTSILKVTADE